MLKSILAAFAIMAFALMPAHADAVKTERVKFAAGTSGATVKGAIRGYDTMHYLLGAQAGQTMRVKLNTKSTSTYFNVFAPGKTPGQDEAMFIGDTGGDAFEGVLPDTGDYLVQVYLYRNAARRNEKASFTLDIAIAAADGDAAADGGAADWDAKVPGTDFNATGEVNCKRTASQPFVPCKFGVVRRGNGNADVTVFWYDGGNRVIFFENGSPVRYDQSEADGGAELSFTNTDGLYSISVGEQRFEFPEAVVFGG